MNFSSDTLFEEESLEINITPLIDIVFLLLIFFMVSTTFVESSGIKVDLPAADTKAATEKVEKLEVSIGSDDTIYFGEEKVSLPQLEEILQQEPEKSRTLILRADKVVTHGLVVNVMDIATKSGFKKLAVATTPSS